LHLNWSYQGARIKWYKIKSGAWRKRGSGGEKISAQKKSHSRSREKIKGGVRFSGN